MNPYAYWERELHIESVSMRRIAAEAGTPCFVYSRVALEEAYRAFDGAFGDTAHLVCYAVKANSNVASQSFRSPGKRLRYRIRR